MGQMWSRVRRRALIGLVAAVCAGTAWAPTAEAASPRTAGNEIPAVGQPQVISLSPASGPTKRHPSSHVKPFLGANAAGLAKAKRRAATTTPGGTSTAVSTSGPEAGIFNNTSQPGLSAVDVGFCCTPPDSTGAIGPNNYVEFVNTEIAVYDRSLNQLSSLDMATFVAAPSGLNVSDPQVQWDPRAGRWFYAAIAFAAHNNYLVFGWSKTADPTNLSAGWCHFGSFTGNQLADYPKLGHDDNFVLFGANLYDDTSGNYDFTTANIWALPKPPAGNLTSCSASGFTSFADPKHRLLNSDGTSAFTPVPVNMSDASSLGYIVAGHSPVAPLPSDPTGPQTKVMLWHTALQGGTPHLFADGDLTVGSFDVPAPVLQPGGPTIDSLDARLTQAVGHADPDVSGAKAIWTQHTINGAGGRSVARWYEILPAGKIVRQQGTVQSSSDFIWNAAISPSIAGNDAAITYDRGGASQLALVAAQARVSSTPLSTLSGGEAVLATSSEVDVDLSCSSPYGPPCRWGDYSGMSPDPMNAGVVWGSNQFNGQSFFGFPQWATQNFAITTNGTPPPPPTPCTGVTWNSPSPASPQAPGTQVALSATAAGCPNPVYQFWVQAPGGSWSVVQSYSSASTATWNTTGLAAGTYSLDVWVKQSGSAADFEAEIKPYLTYTLQIPNTCTAVTWNAPSPASPQAPGVQVNLGGTASGCTNPTYEFWVQAPGGQWTILQAFNSSSTYVWNTTGLATGTYLFDIWVRQSGSSATYEAHITPNPTYTLQTGSPCTSVSMSFNPASPQTAGAVVQLSANAAGCPNPTYEFWTQAPGGAWNIAQGFSPASTFNWNTSGLAAGTYLFDVWVRQSGSSASYEAHISPNPTFVLQAPIACTSVSWNSPSPASPQAPGTQVALSATAAGCPNPVYQFWVQAPGGSWSVVQSYSSASTATWNTTGLAAGTYSLDVWVKQSGSAADFEAEIKPYLTYTLQIPNTCTAVTWNAPSPASPQAPGVQVNLGGTASGCTNPTYEFWVQAPGGQWTILQAFNSSSTYVWNTTGLATGTYLFDIWVRQSGSSATYEAHISPNPTYTLQTGSPCTSVTWNPPSPASPQPPGTQIILGGTASGCPNPTYEFWIQAPGGAWNIVQGFSPSSTYVWSTGGSATGTYLFDIWVRQSGSSASYEAHISPNPTFALQTGPPCTSVTWNAPSPASPQASGTQVMLSATAAGCPNPTYEFWVQAPGGQWTIVQAFSAASTFTWNTAGLPPGTYLFDVWVRQAGSTASYEAHLSPNPSYTLN